MALNPLSVSDLRPRK